MSFPKLMLRQKAIFTNPITLKRNTNVFRTSFVKVPYFYSDSENEPRAALDSENKDCSFKLDVLHLNSFTARTIWLMCIFS